MLLVSAVLFCPESIDTQNRSMLSIMWVFLKNIKINSRILAYKILPCLSFFVRLQSVYDPQSASPITPHNNHSPVL